MNALAPTPTHPWIVSLQSGLDTLETALLHGDATGVEKASASIQTTLQGAPKTAAFAVPGTALRRDMQRAAHRFGQLRQAVLRASTQSQRAVNSVLPQRAPATYGHLAGAGSSTGGAGRAFVSA